MHLADVRAADGDLRTFGRTLALSAPAVVVDAFIERAANSVVSMRETCALDVADREPDGTSLQGAAQAIGVTRERVRQIEGNARRRFEPHALRRGMR
ncbi:MAG: hypothetical protein M3680_02835 [Myxococcota bacterium]|nr:hypothetical protein [Myxococcota bacterium]